MKNKLMIALIVISLVSMTGCNRVKERATKLDYSDCRFEEVYAQDFGAMGFIRVIQDKQTGVKYLYSARGYGAGLCELKEAA